MAIDNRMMSEHLGIPLSDIITYAELVLNIGTVRSGMVNKLV